MRGANVVKTRRQRKKELANQLTIPKSFKPRLWESVDGRVSIAKEIRRRYEALKQDAGVDSYQRDLICQRAIFIGLQLESREAEAAEGKDLDLGVYTQMTNCLLGLLKALGLKKEISTVVNLKAYARSKD